MVFSSFLCVCSCCFFFFFFKQKTAYEMRISDWSSDVCSSDPFHDTLAAELDRLKAAHGKVVLYDAHSIRSHVPRLFDGELPQFNIGTNGGATAAPALASVVASICPASGPSHVPNCSSQGGSPARHYGRPASGKIGREAGRERGWQYG